MHLSEFDYDLPEELIAQEPLARRDASRMLIVNRASQTWCDSQFASLPDHLRANDVLVLNNTRVFPARLRGERARSGGAVERAGRASRADYSARRLWNIRTGAS